jgi:hypothetical protein
MGWYELVKHGQIWQTNYERDSVGSMLSALYELTYKIQTLQNQGFKGYPKRYDNILKGLENSARQVINDMSDILVPVFENWLSGHALLSPKTWASKRIEECEQVGEDTPESIATALLNGVHYDPNDKMPKIQPSDILENMDDAVRNGQASYVSEWFKIIKSEMLEQDLEANEENNNNEHSDYSMSEESIRQANEEMTFSDYCSNYFGDNLTDVIAAIADYYPGAEVYKVFFQFGLFPIWYGYWRTKGIDDTRARVEKAYQTLLQIPNMNINQALLNINIVINTAHQTGDMIDYIVDATGEYSRDIKNLMTQLSNQTDFRDWNKQLKGIGSQFPRKNKRFLPPQPLQEPQTQPLPEEIQQQPVA